jgi:hypothetical protein
MRRDFMPGILQSEYLTGRQEPGNVETFCDDELGSFETSGFYDRQANVVSRFVAVIEIYGNRALVDVGELTGFTEVELVLLPPLHPATTRDTKAKKMRRTGRLILLRLGQFREGCTFVPVALQLSSKIKNEKSGADRKGSRAFVRISTLTRGEVHVA